MNLLLILISLLFIDAEINHIRMLFREAPTDKLKAEQLISKTGKYSSFNTVYKGYNGAGKMIMAKHVFNPLTKLNLYNEGKEILEEALHSEKSNLELHYLRFVIQTNSPKFLGYHTQVNSDKMYLQENLSKTSDKELASLIRNYLTTYK